MCWRGSRAARRAMPSQNRASKSQSRTVCSSLRRTPWTNAAISSASVRGEGTPASASLAVASAISSSSSVMWRVSRVGGEFLRHFCVEQCLYHRAEVAVQHLVEVVGLEPHAVVGDAVLREVVGADALGPVDRADLR